MRVYVAGPWRWKPIVQHAIAYLLKAGHVITHDWTSVEEEDPETFPAHAEADLDGVRRAEVVLVLAHKEARGTYAELGAALALGKRVIVAGVGPCIFERHPRCERVETVAAALRALGVEVP